jgi:hypothetical protein
MRRVVYDGWRFLQYHCCEKRFLSRDYAAAHLAHHHNAPRSREGRYAFIAALEDAGPVAECDNCAHLYAPRKVHGRATPRIAALDTFPEQGRLSRQVFLSEAPPDPLCSYRALAEAYLRRKVADAQHPEQCDAVRQWLQQPDGALEIFAAVLDLDPAAVRSALAQHLPPPLPEEETVHDHSQLSLP